jgi:DNA-binding CsgD family transcriptional regulator
MAGKRLLMNAQRSGEHLPPPATPLATGWTLVRLWRRPSGLRRPDLGIRGGMAVVQLAAIAASVGLLVLEPFPNQSVSVPAWLIIVVGLGLLRVLTAGASLATSSLVLEPIGVVLLLSGTGGTASPFLPMAMAGLWWAARSGRGERSSAFRLSRGPGGLRLDAAPDVELRGNRPTLLAYGISMAVAYLGLVVPPAIHAGTAAEALEDATVLAATWLLAEMAVRRGDRDRAPVERLAAPILIPPRSARSAAELGLSAGDVHLLACLALGLNNSHIAATMQLSEGAVRYRLSRLYRRLGVKGRQQAVDRAVESSLAMPIARMDTAPDP